jgi:nucleoside-diphosphate-sugar epimerase
MAKTIILGCGYIGRRLARYYLDQGDVVLGIVRSAESAASLARGGIPALAWDLAALDIGLAGEPGAVSDRGASAPAALGMSFAGARLFHLAPPPNTGTQDLHTRHLVAAFSHIGNPARVIYVSTTGVYGNCGGAWVDEERPVRPQADRARRRLDAEQTLSQWRGAAGAALVTLRVAGIYGPGRLPLERIRAGLPLVRPEEAPWSNRIHADDLVATCIAAMERGENGAVYNVCDGNPSTMTDYFFQVADAAGLPRPPVIGLADAQSQLSAGMLSYMSESRRLSNRRLVEELGVALRYPHLHEGLASCF